MFWRKLCKIHKSSHISCSVSLQSWFNHFSDLRSEIQAYEETKDTFSIAVEEMQYVTEGINSDVTVEESIKAINTLKVGKTAGHDKLISDLFKKGKLY